MQQDWFFRLEAGNPSRPDIDFDRLNLDEIDFGHPEKYPDMAIETQPGFYRLCRSAYMPGVLMDFSDLEVTIPDSVFNHIAGYQTDSFSPDFSGWNYGVKYEFYRWFRSLFWRSADQLYQVGN